MTGYQTVEKMTEYPERRTVRWVDDVTGDQVGECEYIRADLVEALEAENVRLQAENKRQRLKLLNGRKELTNDP